MIELWIVKYIYTAPQVQYHGGKPAYRTTQKFSAHFPPRIIAHFGFQTPEEQATADRIASDYCPESIGIRQGVRTRASEVTDLKD
jgi:hypothetical protein